MSKKIKLSNLIPDDKNNNKHTAYGMDLLEKSVNKVGIIESITVSNDDKIISGNARHEVIGKNFDKEAIVIETDGTQPIIIKRTDIESNTKQFYEASILANTTSKKNIDFDIEVIESLGVEYDIDVVDLGVDIVDYGSTEEQQERLSNPKKLSDRFIIPPLSVLDTKQGTWQQRKNYWLSLGIKSEEGRDDGMTYAKSAQAPKFYEVKTELRKKGLPFGTDDVYDECIRRGYKLFGNENGSTSIFDPVLCELAYKWFNTPNGKILDPFAGGSVRGIVASKLGYDYLGNDLSETQIKANRLNAIEVLGAQEKYPVWTIGDSVNIDTIAKGYKADLVFSCPHYADLEVYSDMKEDISNMEYSDFIKAYREIIRKSCDILKQDRFAVFVVGDVRDKNGFYRNFVSDTIMAFWNCGVILYNELILVNQIGSGAIRAGKQFSNSRKVVKHHQNVLVFYKGNPKNIKSNYPELDLSYINDFENEDN